MPNHPIQAQLQQHCHITHLDTGTPTTTDTEATKRYGYVTDSVRDNARDHVTGTGTGTGTHGHMHIQKLIFKHKLNL